MQQYFHFYKLKSRLGVINPPYGQSDSNVGVDEAPDYLLSKDYLSWLSSKYMLDEYAYPDPEGLTKESQKSVIVKSIKETVGLILKNTNKFSRQVVLGGDHSVAFSSILARISTVKPSELGYIQIDSHGDSNLFSTSPTGNFHGMFLRPFYANFDCPEIESLINNKLNSRQILFIGNLDLDPEEIRLFADKKISVIDRNKIRTNFESALTQVKDFISSYKYIHVSFDIDVFHKDIVTATGIPAINGLYKRDVFPFLKTIFSHPDVSLDLVEINPFKTGSLQTIRLGQEVLDLYIQNQLHVATQTHNLVEG